MNTLIFFTWKLVHKETTGKRCPFLANPRPVMSLSARLLRARKQTLFPLLDNRAVDQGVEFVPYAVGIGGVELGHEQADEVFFSGCLRTKSQAPFP